MQSARRAGGGVCGHGPLCTREKCRGYPQSAHLSDWESCVLSYDPTAGDKNGSGVKILSDKIVTARAAGQCWLCGLGIEPGTRIRSEVAVVDGKMGRSRTCHACCDAMAISWRDSGRAIEARITAMRQRRGY